MRTSFNPGSEDSFARDESYGMKTLVPSTVDRRLYLVQDPKIDLALSLGVHDCIAKLNASLSTVPVSIVLTGSSARGEGSVLINDQTLRVLGDLEFLVFFESTIDLNGLQLQLNELAPKLEHSLQSSAIHCKLEFSAVGLGYLSKLRPHIFGYELLRHGRTILGRNLLRFAPQFEACNIPKWDAWRMLNNRMIEVLESVGILDYRDLVRMRHILYQVLKCYLDVATTALIFGERYCSTYAGRAAELLDWASEHRRDESLAWLPVIAQRVAACTEFKLNPNASPSLLGVWLADSDEDRLRFRMRAVVLELVSVVRDVWRWETAQISECVETAFTDDQLCNEVLRQQPNWEKMRGWAKLALMPILRTQHNFVRRMARLFHRGSPRYLTYCVASSLFFTLPEVIMGATPQLGSIGTLLPVSFDQYSNESRPWWYLRKNAIHGWHLFLRSHWA